MKRGTWIGHPGPTGRNWTWTSHLFPRAKIHHCGHPTALWPYYFVTINQAGTYSTRSGTFRTLAEAQAAVAADQLPTTPEFSLAAT